MAHGIVKCYRCLKSNFLLRICVSAVCVAGDDDECQFCHSNKQQNLIFHFFPFHTCISCISLWLCSWYRWNYKSSLSCRCSLHFDFHIHQSSISQYSFVVDSLNICIHHNSSPTTVLYGRFSNYTNCSCNCTRNNGMDDTFNESVSNNNNTFNNMVDIKCILWWIGLILHSIVQLRFLQLLFYNYRQCKSSKELHTIIGAYYFPPLVGIAMVAGTGVAFANFYVLVIYFWIGFVWMIVSVPYISYFVWTSDKVSSGPSISLMQAATSFITMTWFKVCNTTTCTNRRRVSDEFASNTSNTTYFSLCSDGVSFDFQLSFSCILYFLLQNRLKLVH